MPLLHHMQQSWQEGTGVEPGPRQGSYNAGHHIIPVLRSSTVSCLSLVSSIFILLTRQRYFLIRIIFLVIYLFLPGKPRRMYLDDIFSKGMRQTDYCNRSKTQLLHIFRAVDCVPIGQVGGGEQLFLFQSFFSFCLFAFFSFCTLGLYKLRKFIKTQNLYTLFAYSCRLGT